jgi:16S rRNA (guanine1207-N2)-methyltransferase
LDRVKSPYRQERVHEDEIGGEPVQLITRPGLVYWRYVPQAMRLIADNAQIEPGQRVLVSPCGHGALGVWAARQAGGPNVTLLDTSIVAVEVARHTMDANGENAATVQVGLPTSADGEQDAVLMVLPKGRDLARLYFLESFYALREGGILYLAGATKEGIKSIVPDAEALFGSATLLSYKGGHRVVRLTRTQLPPDGLPEIYQTPGLAPGTFYQFEATIGEDHYTILSRPGVFSWRAVDEGTRLLLETLQVRATDTILDMGAGYGLIGMHAARQAPKGSVTLVDVDLLACESARATLAANGVEGQVIQGDGMAAVGDQRFTLIVTNPPFHSGHAVNYEVAEAFVEEAYAALDPRGRFVVVSNSFLPYERLMIERFGSVEALARTPQYQVLSSVKEYRRKQRGKLTRAQRKAERERAWYNPDDYDL